MKDLFRLDGKVAVVIGGAGGIGQGIAEAMAFYGAEVVIASRKMESLVRAKSEIKEKVGKDVAIYTAVSYTHLDVYKRQEQVCHRRHRRNRQSRDG